jgi:hypothetical protein
MNNQRLIEKGLVQEKLEEVKRLLLRIDNSIKSINQNLFFYDGVESLEVDAAAAEIEQLKQNRDRFNVLVKEIRKLDPNIYIPRSPAEV